MVAAAVGTTLPFLLAYFSSFLPAIRPEQLDLSCVSLDSPSLISLYPKIKATEIKFLCFKAFNLFL